MTTKSKKIVFTDGEYSIERDEYWGFRCNVTSVSWNILKNGHDLTSCRRLKDAKKTLEEIIKRGKP